MNRCGHDTATSAALCSGCAAGLRKRLHGLPRLYWKLELEVVRATPAPSDRTSGSRSAPLPLPTEALDILLLRVPVGAGDVLDGLAVMEAYARRTRTDRRLQRIARPISHHGRLALACSTLETHWGWLVGQEWSAELNADARLIDRALRSVVEPRGRWVRTRMPCPSCQAALMLDQLDPAEPVIVCSGCDAYWAYGGWEALAAELRTPVRVKDALAFASWLNEWTVRKWIERGLLANHGQPGQPRILLSELLDVYARQNRVSEGA